MRPDHRSRLLGAFPVVLAIVLLAAAAASAVARPAGKGPTTTYVANCNVNLRSSASTSASVLATLASGGTISATGTVSGTAWSGNCPTAVSGTSWYLITKVNGSSVNSLYGVSIVYAATGMFKVPPTPTPTPTPTPGPTPAPTPTPTPSPSYLEGIDVSRHQGSINFSSVKSSGRSFVIAKASEGWGYTDPMWSTNRAGAQAAGLAVTGYHFARPDLNTAPGDPSLEADWFVDTVNLNRGMLIPALDLEIHGTLSVSQLQAWVQEFVERFYWRTGVRVMIYTSPSFWETYMGDTRWFADNGYPLLWVAHWGVSSPRVPAQAWGGRSWTFWQYTNCGSVPGISGCVDLDRFNGSSLSRVTY